MCDGTVGKLKIGEGQPLAVIAGPCVIESEAHALKMAERLSTCHRACAFPMFSKPLTTKPTGRPLNPIAGRAWRAGSRSWRESSANFGVPILTDVHEVEQVQPAAEVCDILQIPAFLSRQTDLLLEVGRSGAVVNIKKGQFLSPWDIRHAIEKVRSTGNDAHSRDGTRCSFGLTTWWWICGAWRS